MKKRVPFLVLALMASAATGQAATHKPKTEKSKSSATASAKRKSAEKSSGDGDGAPKKDTASQTPAAKANADADKAGAKDAKASPASEVKTKTAATDAKPDAKSSTPGATKPKAAPPTMLAASLTPPPKPAGPAPKPEQPLVAGAEVELVGDVLPDIPKHRSDLAELAKASARDVSAIKALKPGEDKPPVDNAGEEPAKGWRGTGPTVTLAATDLVDFENQPVQVQRLIQSALDLTKRNLRYKFGSADPSTGGIDCSGVIQYLLKQAGIADAPRDSTGFYLWTEKAGTLQKVRPEKLDDPALADLRPGDLMFWEGTYDVKRDPPISHIMIYLGREKQTGLPVMVGSSDGRTYAGIRRNGVRVFDFKLPKASSKAKFVGFARVPSLLAATASR
jgi:cell wall-associated NlpC family hydrolase